MRRFRLMRTRRSWRRPGSTGSWTDPRRRSSAGRATPCAAILSRKCGFSPVHSRAATAVSSRRRTPSSSSGGFARKMSWSVITSDSMRSTSVMWEIRREPSTRRVICTSRSNALEICSRIARSGRSTPAVRTSVSSLDSASRGEFAWIVVSEPSWPVFMAWSMSSVSAPRTSPTMIRSGRMRREFRTSSRMRISPWPSMFGGPRLERDHVLLLELELGGVLDRDDSLVAGDERRDRVQRRRLTGAGTTGDEHVQLPA